MAIGTLNMGDIHNKDIESLKATDVEVNKTITDIQKILGNTDISSMGNITSILNSLLTNNIRLDFWNNSIEDCNTVTNGIFTYGGNTLNTPLKQGLNQFGFGLIISVSNGTDNGYGTQLCFGMGDTDIYIRRNVTYGWTDWEIPYTPKNDIEIIRVISVYPCVRSAGANIIRHGNLVTIYIAFDAHLTANSPMFLIPEHIRPKSIIQGTISCKRNTDNLVHSSDVVFINPDGNIYENFNSDGDESIWSGTITFAYTI